MNPDPAPVTPESRLLPSASSHPTRDKLLATVLDLMAEKPPEQITSDLVLQTSGISRGSLYHHFEDFPELIETALVLRFASHVDRSITMLSGMVMNGQSKEQVLALLTKATRATQDTALAPVRYERARLIGMSENSPRLARKLAQEQHRLTEALTDLFREMQGRGWMSSDFDAHAAAVLIQAYTLGKIVDDIATDKVDPEAWNRLIDRLMFKGFA